MSPTMVTIFSVSVKCFAQATNPSECFHRMAFLKQLWQGFFGTLTPPPEEYMVAAPALRIQMPQKERTTPAVRRCFSAPVVKCRIEFLLLRNLPHQEGAG